jgi:hypothetical protein
LTCKQEQFYKQQIAELQVENAALKEQVAELLKVNGELAEKVAKVSKNFSNSSKPPSSYIVKPPKAKQADVPRRQGGQSGHKGTKAQRNRVIERISKSLCPRGPVDFWALRRLARMVPLR